MSRSLLLISLLAVPCLAQDGPAKTGERVDARRYRVSYESSVDMDLSRVGQGKMALTANTEVDYSFGPAGKKFSVMLDRLHVTTVVNGVENMDVTMGPDGIRVVEAGQTNEVPYADADAPTQEMLRDTHREPLASIEVDETGKELSRTPSTRPGAENMLENGGLQNTRFFHAPYPPEGATWEVEREFAMGNGNVARGTLTYTRGEKGKDGTVTVAVKGTLKGSGKQGPLDIKDATYVLDGKQVWDPTLGDWSEGKLDVAMSMTMFQGAKQVGSAEGKIVASLARRSADAKKE